MSNQTRDYLAREVMGYTDDSDQRMWRIPLDAETLERYRKRGATSMHRRERKGIFDPLTNLNHLAMVLGKLSEEQYRLLDNKMHKYWLSRPKDFYYSGTSVVDALLLFANEPAKLCDLIVEADKEGK